MAENGNNSAVHEALLKASDALTEATHHNLTEEYINECLALIHAVLSAFPRNCDIGTPEEQAKRFAQYCDRYPQCMGCPLRKKMLYNCCECRWAQLPYEEGEANG